MKRISAALFVWLIGIAAFSQSVDSLSNEVTSKIMTGRLLRQLSMDALEEKGGRVVKHIVEQGETMESIAESYGISKEELMCMNPFEELCYTGLELDIPVCITDAELYDVKRASGNSYYARAEELFNKGDYKGAIDIYNQLVNDEGITVIAHYNRGIAYYRRGRLKSAMRDMAYVCQKDESNRFPNASKLFDSINKELERRREQRQRNWANFLNNVAQVAGNVLNQYVQYKQQGNMQNAGYGGAGGSALNAELPAAFDFTKYDFSQHFTTDANGNVMVSSPGLAAATQQMNAAVQSACSQAYGKLMATGDSYYMARAQSLQVMAQTNNWTSQIDQILWSTPMYPEAVGTSGVTYEVEEGEEKTYQSTYTPDCHLCRGLKKCWTCNGRREYLNPMTGKYVACPNCTDGLCSACGGTGKKSGR